MLVLAHLSDLHLDGGSRASARAKSVVDYLAGIPSPLDAVLVSGDIADHGLPDEYAEADKLLAALPYPVLTCPGNHDVRACYREGLLGEPGSDDPINQVVPVGRAVFALCDSSIPGEDGGFLSDDTLTWLEGVLDESADRPVFIAFHHPPVRLHSPFVDAIRQRGAERLTKIVTRHPQVVALLCGHAHTPAASTFAGRPLLVAPGVVSTLMLPWEPAPDLDLHLPPVIAFHILSDDGELVTHYRVVPVDERPALRR